MDSRPPGSRHRLLLFRVHHTRRHTRGPRRSCRPHPPPGRIHDPAATDAGPTERAPWVSPSHLGSTSPGRPHQTDAHRRYVRTAALWKRAGAYAHPAPSIKSTPRGRGPATRWFNETPALLLSGGSIHQKQAGIKREAGRGPRAATKKSPPLWSGGLGTHANLWAVPTGGGEAPPGSPDPAGPGLPVPAPGRSTGPHRSACCWRPPRHVRSGR